MREDWRPNRHSLRQAAAACARLRCTETERREVEMEARRAAATPSHHYCSFRDFRELRARHNRTQGARGWRQCVWTALLVAADGEEGQTTGFLLPFLSRSLSLSPPPPSSSVLAVRSDGSEAACLLSLCPSVFIMVSLVLPFSPHPSASCRHRRMQLKLRLAPTSPRRRTGTSRRSPRQPRLPACALTVRMEFSLPLLPFAVALFHLTHSLPLQRQSCVAHCL